MFSRTASGNTPPLRMITGAATQLSWPVGIYVDTTRDEIGVASYDGNAIQVFSRTADGNVAPIRVISGPSTLLAGPTGLAFSN